MQMATKALVEPEKLIDPQGSEQKRNGQARGIESEKKNATGNRFGRRGHGQYAGEYRSDTRCPTERESKTEQEAAENASEWAFAAFLSGVLAAQIAEVHVAIE